MRQIRSAGIIVYHKNNGDITYLLLQYLHGHWDFVKGKLEPGENKQETALRELHEETGITSIDIDTNFSTSLSYVYTERDGIVTKKTVYFFIGHVPDTHVVLSPEHTDYTWLSLQDALELLTFKNAKKVLLAADKFITNN